MGKKPTLRVVEPPSEPGVLLRNAWMWMLGAGAGIIAGAVLITATHLRDRIVFTLLIPGVVVGLVLVVLSMVLRRRSGVDADLE